MKPGVIVLAIVLALIATIAAFILILPDKKRASLPKIAQALHDFLNFKYLIIEKILKFMYVFATASTIVLGVFMLFSFQKVWGEVKWQGGSGLVLILVGPFAIRIAYEFIMMAILLVKNVTDINRKLKGDSNEENQGNVFATPDYSSMFNRSTPTAPAQSCPHCGNTLDSDGRCPRCNP